MRHSTFLTVAAAACLLVGGSVTAAFGQAAVTTDRDSYSPGDVVIITGTGWSPGEDVLLTISQDSTLTFRASYVAVADAAGEIANADFVIEPGDTNRAFHLAAEGQASGLTAETAFLDGFFILNVAVGSQSPSPVYSGSTATYPITIQTRYLFSCQNSTANLLIDSPLPSGVSASFDPSPVYMSASGWYCYGTSTLRLHTSSSTPSGSYSITVRAQRYNDANDYATALINLYVVRPNHPPDANNDSYTTNEDATLAVPAPGILGNDYDRDGDAIYVYSYTSPSHGSVSMNYSSGAFTYTPASNYNGSDYFTYRVRDSHGSMSNSATVSLSVYPVNDPPIADNRSYTMPEDHPGYGCALHASDVDDSYLVWEIVAPPAHGSGILYSQGSYVYTPDPNYNGADQLRFRVRDPHNAYSNTATISITITPVNDIPVPAVSPLPTVAGSCPGPVIAPAPMANDVEDGVIQGTTSDPVSHTTPGSYTIHWSYQDSNGAVVSQNQQVTVVDETPPLITCEDFTVFAETDSCTISVGFNPQVSDECSEVTFTPKNGEFGLGVHEVTLTAHDSAGNEATCVVTVTVENATPVATITGPTSGALYAIDIPVELTGTYHDYNKGPHTAVFVCGGTTIPGSVVQEGANGTVTATHAFENAGVYPVTLMVTDQCGATGTGTTIGDVDALVVVYDPSAGFVTGGGWIDSPAGAYAPDSTLVGKANFGFVSKYQKGATTPTGETEFRFRVADLNFHSTSYDWLVIAGAQAQYKGTGTVNGTGNYGFMLSATDGEIIGGGGVDRFRIKIVDKDSDAVVYDNMRGASDNAEPVTALGGGSIVVHKTATGKGSDPQAGSAVLAQQGPTRYALLPNYPNPFNPTTHIRFDLPVASDVTLDIYDVAGRLVTRLVDRYMPIGRHDVTWDGTSGSGTRVASGVYFYRIRAGTFHETRRMVMIK